MSATRQQRQAAARQAVWTEFKSPNGSAMLNTESKTYASRRERRASVKKALRSANLHEGGKE